MRKETDSWQADIADIVNDQFKVLLRLGHSACFRTFKEAVLCVADGLSFLGCDVSVEFFYDCRHVHFYGFSGVCRFSLNVPFPKFEV